MSAGLSGPKSQPAHYGEEITLLSLPKIDNNSRFPAYGLISLQSDMGSDNNLRPNCIFILQSKLKSFRNTVI
jgi:hypothetical protein